MGVGGFLGFGEIPVGASGGQGELAQYLLVLTVLGPQFQIAKRREEREEEWGRKEGRKEGKERGKEETGKGRERGEEEGEKGEERGRGRKWRGSGGKGRGKGGVRRINRRIMGCFLMSSGPGF